MNQEEIAVMFRQQELARRGARWARLENELKLAGEFLTPTDQALHNAAANQLKRNRLALEKEISPGYWQRLWAALFNK